jgi:hypothetical protein
VHVTEQAALVCDPHLTSGQEQLVVPPALDVSGTATTTEKHSTTPAANLLSIRTSGLRERQLARQGSYHRRHALGAQRETSTASNRLVIKSNRMDMACAASERGPSDQAPPQRYRRCSGGHDSIAVARRPNVRRRCFNPMNESRMVRSPSPTGSRERSRRGGWLGLSALVLGALVPSNAAADGKHIIALCYARQGALECDSAATEAAAIQYARRQCRFWAKSPAEADQCHEAWRCAIPGWAVLALSPDKRIEASICGSPTEAGAKKTLLEKCPSCNVTNQVFRIEARDGAAAGASPGRATAGNPGESPPEKADPPPRARQDSSGCPPRDRPLPPGVSELCFPGKGVPRLAVTGALGTPRRIWFGKAKTTDGSIRESREISLKNTGTGPLRVQSISLGGTHAGQFKLYENISGRSLARGETATVTVSYAPKARGSHSALVIITTNAGKEEHIGVLGEATP